MIPFIKLNTRRFHVTSKIFVRKVAPKTLSNDQKQETLENHFNSTSNYENSSPDYLGIEGDENVITVKPQKHGFQKPQNRDIRETFYRTSFGIIRFDAENKLKYHGQYKRKIDFTFPHSSSEGAKVSNISETSSHKNHIYRNLSLKDSQKVSTHDTLEIKDNEPTSSKDKNVDLNYIDECYFRTSKTQNNPNFTQNNTQQSSPEELNYLEKDYFETLVHSKNLSVGHNSSKHADSKEDDFIFCNKNDAEKLNYSKTSYFDNSEEINREQDSADYSISNKVDSSLGSNDQSNESNYLEENYFRISNNSESDYMKQNMSNYEKKTNSTVSVNYQDTIPQNNNFIPAVDELQYLEKKFWGALDDSEDQHAKKDMSIFADYEKKINSTVDINHQNTVLKNNNPAVDELHFPDKSFYENYASSNDQNSLCNDDLQKVPSHFIQNNEIIKEDIYDNSNENIQDNKIKIQNNTLGANNSVAELKESTQKQSYEVNFKKSSSKTQKSDKMPHKSTEPSLKNSNLSEILCKETIKSFSVENNFKFPKLVSEESDSNDQESTAYDFVKQLREKQKIPSVVHNISKEKSTNKEKFDSKGFRIYKDQVPNLAYFTHDEILNILKQNIVYSDDDLLILNKPYGLVIHESKTTKEPCLSKFLDDLAKEMDKQSTNPKLFTVHRLDKETTGCLLLARNETMAMHLKALFAQRKIVKKYWIITVGVPDPPEGVIDIPITEGSVGDRKRMVLVPKLPDDIQYKNHSKEGKPAITTYKVISESGNAALVEVFPKTGVTHQIRVHFGFGLGCPILGDHKYSHLDKLVPQKLPTDMLQKFHVRQSKVRHIPMHIHAKSVGIPEYFDKRDLFVNIPIPDYVKKNLKLLKFRKKDMIH